MSIQSFKKIGTAQKDDGTNILPEVASLPELVQYVPVTFRPACGQVLQEVYRVAVKASHVQTTLATLNRHSTEGSFPASILGAIKDPKIQFSKEFRVTAEGSTVEMACVQAIDTARTTVLGASLDAKKAELTHLQTLLAFDSRRWVTVCSKVMDDFASTTGATVEILSDGSRSYKNMPIHVIEEEILIRKQGRQVHMKAVGLAYTASQREVVSRMAKLSLKKNVDTEMTGIDASKSTAQIVREEVAKALRQALPRGTSAPLCSQKPRYETLTGYRKRQWESQTLPAETFEGYQEEGNRKRQRTRQRERQEEVSREVTEFERRKTSAFVFSKPETFPDCYLNISDCARLAIHYREHTEDSLATLRDFDPGIFKLPGLVLPRQVEYTLAVNHKFILHDVLDTSLLEEAFNKLRRTVRIRWQFRDREDTNFDPRFHVSNPNWNPAKAQEHIERGLDKGKDALLKQVAHLNLNRAHAPNPDLRTAQSFLQSRMLLIKLTDKNLGIACLSRDWYLAECVKHLQSKNYFKYEDAPDTTELLEDVLGKFDELKLPEKFRKFVHAKTESQYPRFHVIPKVHKNPWGSRPIVPSHSWITSRMSEVADSLLRPLLLEFPWVVDSTKEVLQQVQRQIRYPESDVWLVTGDVEAFYTNVPIVQSSREIGSLWKKFKQGAEVSHDDVKQLLLIIMSYNFFEHDGDVYRQQEGVAMGTSCAPLVANLYAALKERRNGVHRLRSTVGKLLLYVRYIDDILLIFRGSEKELMEYLAKDAQLDGLNISWSYSRSRQVFLDVELLMMPGHPYTTLETRVYRKPMNKHLYIPWSSAHPLHVKKAFVKAELTRFRMISSNQQYFVDTCLFFRRNLRRRGYPANVLDSWFTKVRYSDRPLSFIPKEEDSDVPLLLPSRYNQVWEYINVGTVLKAMRDEWYKGEVPPALRLQLIRSLSRSSNVFDLTSAWNLTILNNSPLL